MVFGFGKTKTATATASAAAAASKPVAPAAPGVVNATPPSRAPAAARPGQLAQPLMGLMQEYPLTVNKVIEHAKIKGLQSLHAIGYNWC